jgi:hypothetical protein
MMLVALCGSRVPGGSVSLFDWIHSQFEDHPIRSAVASFIAWMIVYGATVKWLVRAYGRDCHGGQWVSRHGWHIQYLDCDFDIAPGVDFALKLLVFGGPFYGPLMVAVVVGLPLFYFWYGAQSMRRALWGAPPERPPPPPPSPYGDMSAHVKLLRERGVPEDEIEAILRTYKLP